MTDVPEMRMAVGHGLYVMMLPVEELQEQDLNAQVMPQRHFERLTANIADRGQIESLPYVSWPDMDGRPAIISGHHRKRAAAAAGVTHIPALVDTLPMTKSRLRAKQLAHNELHGEADEDIRAQMLDEIDEDDLLMTGLDPEDLALGADDDQLDDEPEPDLDWRVMTLVFLPPDIEQFVEVLDAIDTSSDLVGVAVNEVAHEFTRAAREYGQAVDVRSIDKLLLRLTDLARQRVALDAQTADEGDWVPLEAVLGSTKVPGPVAVLLEQVITLMLKHGDVGKKNRWQILEYLAAEYLAWQQNPPTA